MLLFRGAMVYAPRSLGVVDVLVSERIEAIAPRLPPPPRDWPVEELDLSDRLLVPGFIDVHVHLTGGGGEGGAETRVSPLSFDSLASAGVTTAVGLLGTDGTTRSMADLLACARGLEAQGITCFCYTGAYSVPPPTLTGSVRGDIVHIDRIVAVGEIAISDHRSSQPTFDELVRLASDAHVAGMMTKKAGLLHLHLGDGARGLALVRRALEETELPARVFHPTHCNRNRRLWEEAKELSRRFGCSIDVTAGPDDGSDAPSAAESIADALASGVHPARITMSSDAGGALPEFDADGNLLRMGVGTSASLLESLREARQRGVPFERALATITENPATLFRFRDKGRIVTGAAADLVVLAPELEIESVIARGRRVHGT